MQNALTWISITVVAALYSAVGHGGGTGYLAILSLLQVPPPVMATTALTLNCMTAGISFFAYTRAGYLSWRLTLPFVATSVPAAVLGAMVKLSENQYNWLLGSVLILTALKLAFFLPENRLTSAGNTSGSKSDETNRSPDEDKSTNDESAKSTNVPNQSATPNTAPTGRFIAAPSWIKASMVGAALGFLAGSVGIGGGIFLSPVIILMGWADTKSTSATAAFFIIANSLAGLTGRAIGGTLSYGEIVPYLICGCIGAIAGSTWGVRFSTGTTLRRVLALVLFVAATNMFITK